MLNYIDCKLDCCRSLGIDLMSESDLALIATDGWYSYTYVRDVLKDRFELGEAAIATDAWVSYRYACDVLKGRFELGEEAIATSAQHSCWYAHDALKGRFELGEEAIASHSYYKKKYNNLMVELGIDYELH